MIGQEWYYNNRSAVRLPSLSLHLFPALHSSCDRGGRPHYNLWSKAIIKLHIKITLLDVEFDGLIVVRAIITKQRLDDPCFFHILRTGNVCIMDSTNLHFTVFWGVQVSKIAFSSLHLASTGLRVMKFSYISRLFVYTYFMHYKKHTSAFIIERGNKIKSCPINILKFSINLK